MGINKSWNCLHSQDFDLTLKYQKPVEKLSLPVNLPVVRSASAFVDQTILMGTGIISLTFSNSLFDNFVPITHIENP